MNINNNKQYEQLDSEGKLYSQTKDGKPVGIYQNILAKLYPIILVVITILDLILIKKLVKKINWESFVITVFICWSLGIMWNSMMMSYDPKFQSWMFNSWSTIPILDKFWFSHILDWIFYPLCGCFFIFLLEITNNENLIKTSIFDNIIKMLVIDIYLLLIIFGLFLDPASRLEIVFFALPGLIGIVYLWINNKWDIKQFIICSIVFILIAYMWDLLATTWLHNKNAWCQQYFYISFDKAGNYYHSNLFRSYSYKWAWIGQSPFAITPLFSVYGCLFIYGIYYSIKNLFANHKKQS
jgi:hypothetical protein